MVTAKQLSEVILVLGFQLLKTGVDGFNPRKCPTAAIVDLTDEEPDSSGFVNKSGQVFPSESLWKENGRTFGCPCDFKSCAQLCCPAGYALRNGSGCAEDKYTSKYLKYENLNKDHHYFTQIPCSSTPENYALHDASFALGPDGAIYVENFGTTVPLGKYCLVRRENSQRYLIGACTEEEGSSLVFSLLVCVNIAQVFTILTFIVYTVIPELRNLQGLILRSYLASYIACIFFMTLALANRFPLTNIVYQRITRYGMRYFGMACVMWMNVMSFDMWWTFRKFRPNQDVDIKKRQKTKFILYSIYVLGGSAVPTTIWSFSFTFRVVGSLSKLYYFLMFLPLFAIGISNTFFFTATAYKIKQQKKETAHLISSVNKHHQENEQWFNLYVKLFIIMIGSGLLWIAGFVWRNEIFFICISIVEALRGLSIFLMFVWKDDVKQSARKRIVELSSTLSSCFRPGLTRITEN